MVSDEPETRHGYKRTRRILPLRNFNELLDVPDFFRLQGGIQVSSKTHTATKRGVLAIVESLEGSTDFLHFDQRAGFQVAEP